MHTERIVMSAIHFVYLVTYYQIFIETYVYCNNTDLYETDAEVNTSKGLSAFNESTSLPRSYEDIIDSCKNKCGRWNLLPCSCDLKCLVYSNCCEDFMEECPETARKSIVKFAGLIRAKTKCVFDTFVLKSCPKERKSVNVSNVKTRDQQRSLDNSNVPFAMNENKGNYPLSKIMNSIPVSDLTTGLTFANLSVYDCNKLNTSLPVLWKVNSDALENQLKINLLSVAIVVEKLQGFNVRPPEYIEESIKTSVCAQNVIGECQHRISGVSWDPVRCSSFISYVSDSVGVFRNKYCAACNGSSSAVPVTEEMWHMFAKHHNDFTIMMSLDKKGLTFTPEYDEQFKGSLRVKWSIMECNISDERNLTDWLNCQVTCKEPSEKRPDGVCKEMTHLHIALPSSAASSISKKELNQLSTSIHCYLSKVARLDVLERWNQLEVEWECELEGKCYLLEFFIYETEPLFTRNLLRKYQGTFIAMAQSLSILAEKIFTSNETTFGLTLNQTKLLAYINPLCFRLLPDVTSKQSELNDDKLTCLNISMNDTDYRMWMDGSDPFWGIMPPRYICYTPTARYICYTPTARYICYTPTARYICYTPTARYICYTQTARYICYTPTARYICYTPTARYICYTPTARYICYTPTARYICPSLSYWSVYIPSYLLK
ncbi:hypothetical protein Btru_046906 [Bulinus truncatus]|nr:hypothetical protein Btru_046906 [Bulinus truncatus]